MNIVAEARGIDAHTLLGQGEPARSSDTLRWSRFLAGTSAEGPGLRAALWVQGCTVHCPGCFNPQMWATRGGTLSTPQEVADLWLAQARDAGSTGLTMLGGEPFDQAGPLSIVARTFRRAGLSVMAFSGYDAALLARSAATRPDIAALLSETDLLCDGPYLRDLPDTRRPWIGSTNQSIRALTDRYAAEVRALAVHGGQDSVEIRIGIDGTIGVNGWADDSSLAALLDDLGVRADAPLRQEDAA